jgi:hypothetical protein
VGGDLWIVVDVIFVAALAAAIIYGYLQWRNRRQLPPAVEKDAVDHAYREEPQSDRR